MMTQGHPVTRATRTRLAAPTGGARLRGRGCIVALLLLPGLSFAAPQFETGSGQSVTLEEVLLDENPGELWVRFRFMAPDIARGLAAVVVDVAASDMQKLCDDVAVPYLVDNSISPARIVVSLSDRLVPFGQPDPEATQFFELYSLQDGSCIWEEF